MLFRLAVLFVVPSAVSHVFAVIFESGTTDLLAKRDSDVMFCLQSNQGLIIDISLVHLSYPQD